MPKIAYTNFNFRDDSLIVIERTNQIIDEYQAQGFILTLRQAYYQHVSRGWIPNTEQSYKRLGSIINDARLAGLIDWNALEDRTRFLRSRTHWANPADIMNAVGQSYFKDMWKNQTYRPEVWIEKDALVGVIEGVCEELDVPFFSCRGYTSQSEMWRAGQRLKRYIRTSQIPVIFHLGDHDPSGMDMSRDITDRLELFTGEDLNFNRIALNIDQVRQYDPPPNPAKLTDSRVGEYIRLHGDESWELDALEPRVLADLIRSHIEVLKDVNAWRERAAEIEEEKATLAAAANRWSEVVTFLGRLNPTPEAGQPEQRTFFVCFWCDKAIPDHYDVEDMDSQKCPYCGKFFCEDCLETSLHNCDGQSGA